MEWDAAFVTFVRDQADGLRRAAWLLTGEPSAASDLVQDTLTRLYPKWDRVLRAESPAAYVRRAMVNQFLSDRRRHRTTELVTPDFPDAVQAPPELDQVLDRDQLATPLAALTPRQRAAITLRYYYDLSDQDVAHAMGCPVVTVRSHVRRALAVLRVQLEERPDAVGSDHGSTQ